MFRLLMCGVTSWLLVAAVGADERERPAVEKDVPVPKSAALKLNGVVRDTTDGGLVEISLGADDGVTRGLQFHVYRGGTKDAAAMLVGRIEIVKTSADVSVGKALAQFTKGKIEKGDRVATQVD